MLDVSVSGKQRLRELENTIRNNFEGWVNTGFALIEIRDNRLYEHAGYKNWTEYQKKRLALDFGIETAQCTKIIRASVVRTKIGNLGSNWIKDEKTDWNVNAALELARLAPKKKGQHGNPRDVQSLNKVDVTRVAKAAAQEAKKLNKPITAPIVRKAVDADLGIDRAAKAKKTKKQREKKPEHRDLVLRYTGQIEGMCEVLAPIPEDAWKILEEDNPGILQKFIDACENLKNLMRS